MRRHFIIILLLLVCGFVKAQSNTNSPYSALGIGEVDFYGDAFTNALGGVSATISDSSEANFFNPATYANIAKQLPIFSFGLNHFEKTIGSSEMSSKSRFTGFTHLGLAIPFGNRLGMAAGIKPFSRIGYEIHDEEMVNGESIHYVYEGNGGVQEVFLGFSSNILARGKHSLSLGINGIYYFGTVDHQRRAYINTNKGETGGLDKELKNPKGLTAEIGLNYAYQINSRHNIKIGGVYRQGRDINFDRRHSRMFFGDYMSQSSYDTIMGQQLTRGSIYLPTTTKLGIAYVFTPQEDSARRRTKLPSYLFTFEYGLGEWSKYKEDFGDGTTNNVFVNSTSYRFGFEFTPHYISASQTSSFIKFYDKIKYRAGAYWVNTPYFVNNEQLVNKGVTVGLGIPFMLHRAVSTVSLSGSYGVMGNNNSTNVKENYFGINIGINIAPGYDRWFRKYKYD